MSSIIEALSAVTVRRARPQAVTPERKSERSKKFYSSLPWKRMRYRILAENAEKHGGKPQCELCGKGAAPGEPLNIDHIYPLSRYWERRLDSTNLQVLCGNCNHGKLAGPARDFR